MLTQPEKWPRFRYHIKQRGALLAKGRLLGVQFAALMENGLYVELGRKANAQAQRVKTACAACGFPMLCDTLANQIFPVLPNAALATLSEHFSFARWATVDAGHTAVRFCAGATTPDANVDALVAALKALKTDLI